jgi:hypothetical protein
MYRALSLLVVSGCLLLNSSAAAQTEDAQLVLDRYQVIRPSDDELAMYRLDWAPSLEAALKRSAIEKRPVALVIIHAQYGDLSSGHC